MEKFTSKVILAGTVFDLVLFVVCLFLKRTVLQLDSACLIKNYFSILSFLVSILESFIFLVIWYGSFASLIYSHTATHHMQWFSFNFCKFCTDVIFHSILVMRIYYLFLSLGGDSSLYYSLQTTKFIDHLYHILFSYLINLCSISYYLPFSYLYSLYPFLELIPWVF